MSIDVEQNPYLSSPDEAPEQYRALSSAAVAALVFGLLSLSALLDTWLVVVPIVGVVWGLIALKQIRTRPAEFSGGGLAICGLALSCVMLFAGPAFVYYQEIAPVPPGHQIIDYDVLQPDPYKLGEAVPKSAEDLNGKKVYIKGYVYAGNQSEELKKFMLVRDAGTCCFGGNPKTTDRIIVSLANKGGTLYTKQVVRVAGVFRLAADVPGVYYYLDQAELR